MLYLQSFVCVGTQNILVRVPMFVTPEKGNGGNSDTRSDHSRVIMSRSATAHQVQSSGRPL